jgi:cytochrome d ubiquinol oxidase subunit I
MVAAGTLLSAFWILAANSWMQTPAGHEIRDGIAVPVDWVRVIFNPSFPYRLAHMVTAAYLTTSFVVLAVGARYLVAGRHTEEARTMLRMGVGFIAIVAPLQVLIGDLHALHTLKYQPMKIAAVEAHWDGSKPADFHIIAWPNEKAERNDFAISIPKAGSLVVTHDPNGLFPGLKDVPPGDRPPVALVFYAFRIMVLIGFAMVGTGWVGAWLWWRGRLFDTGWFLRPAANVWWAGFVAVIAGWIVTESGRQPWVAYGILRTADAISPVPGGSVLTTLVLFVIVYGIIFSMGIYYINRLIHMGPTGPSIQAPEHGLPNRPLSAAEDAAREALGVGRIRR